MLVDRLFSYLQTVSSEIQVRDQDDPELLSVVPRILDLMESRKDLDSMRELVSTAARALGLWNYIGKPQADARDRLLIETIALPKLGGITLHREQVAALNTLLSGKNLVLSAPTSFGKSVLIDALIAEGHYDRVAIVLPTIALLDEFRRRLLQRFGDTYDVLMHHTEVAERNRVIFLGTQERLINREDLGSLDLLVVDEFYKLDPGRKDERSLTLNAAVYQLLRRARQFFFLGPNINSVRVSADTRWRFEFLRTRFSTVAIDTLDLRAVDDKQERLLTEAVNEEHWPALVFVSSPDRANNLSRLIVERRKQHEGGSDLSHWIEANYGGRSFLSESIGGGIGLHHGRIPRSLAAKFIKLFNEGELPILLCTSTLIEGVNTAAKTVFIFDKSINKEDYDFFTFSNIKGRAGRLGQHHVGRVVLFNAPPDAESVHVTPPLFSELDQAPEELVVHIDDEDLTPDATERIDDVAEELGLTLPELRRLSALGIDNLRALKSAVGKALNAGVQLAWTGFGRYPDIERTAAVICKVKQPGNFGVRSARQLAMYINKLRSLHSLKSFYEWHSESFTGDKTDWDNVFKFLRACDYSLPEYFGAVETFVRKVHPGANYGFFIARLVRWFRPVAVKELEDQGIPAQISERVALETDTALTLGAKLRSLAVSRSNLLSPIEAEWVLESLPQRESTSA